MFVLYTSQLFTIIKSDLADVCAYAYDTQVFISFNANSSEEQSAAQSLYAIWQA